MVHALHLANGETINDKLRSDNSRVEQLLVGQTPAYRIIEEVYLAALTRYPNDNEMKQLLPLVVDTKAEQKREVIEDLFWSVLTSREFLFQH